MHKGNVYLDMGRLQEALESHKTALKIDEEVNNKFGLAKDYGNIGLVLGDMGKNVEALESHNNSLEINKEMDDKVQQAKNYYNISFVLLNTSKHEALKSLYNALRLLQDFEKQNGYHYPLMDRVNYQISHVKEEL